MSYKVCPICGTPAHPNAMLCSTCGTSLAEVEVLKRDKRSTSAKQGYDRRYGEADLLEGELQSRGRMYLFSAALVIIVSLCGIGAFYLGTRVLNAPQATPTSAGNPSQNSASGSQPPIEMATNTPSPTIFMPTVTPAPPTATFTATEGPCTRQVQAGDDLISLLFSCGHRSMDVVPQVLEMNNLSAPEALQAGQTLLIPWPTPTSGPTAETAATDAAGSVPAGTSEVLSVPDSNTLVASNAPAEDGGSELSAFAPEPTAFPTATLMPGVAWHVIQPNENMLSIAFQYNTNAETLSQLNPEIAFSQCDFQYDSGGERCTVLIQEGASIRVPVPPPTATLSPTLSGSETPTFTPTPTYNAPTALSPGNRALFRRDELITLRWMGSGLLSSGEVYRVTVEDLTTRTMYTADTSELFYIIPASWQGLDGQRHEYQWTVSVVRLNDPEHPTFTTEARLFTWDGRGES